MASAEMQTVARALPACFPSSSRPPEVLEMALGLDPHHQGVKDELARTALKEKANAGADDAGRLAATESARARLQ